MRNKKIMLVPAALLLVTLVLAVINRAVRETAEDNTVLVRWGSSERSIPITELDCGNVEGTLINGKDEKTSVSGRGIALAELAEGEFASVRVTSDDEYSAEVTFKEIGNAYLILREDGSVQLCVFGDSNSRRAVRNVKRVEFVPAEHP